jgi:hypothetical protein
VRQATTERAIDYPVAVENDYAIWNAFTNNAWPALYIIDTDGRIRDRHFGEGRYEKSKRLIQKLLGLHRELVSVEGLGVEAGPTGTTSARRHAVPLRERDKSLASTDRATTFRLPSWPCRFDPGHALHAFLHASQHARPTGEALEDRPEGPFQAPGDPCFPLHWS